MSKADPALVDRLTGLIQNWRAGCDAMLAVGLCGAQGSGKSTLCVALAERLSTTGLRVAILSLDDLYLTRAERFELGRVVHPLLATRGVPGTHDLPLGLDTLAALRRGEAVPLPRFDKGHDDRADQQLWPSSPTATDVLLFEGWCTGARPQPDAALTQPVNALEQTEDPDQRWRRYVNAALAQRYPQLWAQLDRLILLAAPGWHAVAGWREEQEAMLRRTAPAAMSTAQVHRFVQHYERLTRWILEDMPDFADVIVPLDEARRPL